MADDGNGENGKDRVTVAIVGAEVREIKAIVAGHAEATGLKLDAIKDKLLPLSALPEKVTRLEEKQDALGVRVDDIEAKAERRREWRRAAATTAAFAVVGFLVNLSIALHWL